MKLEGFGQDASDLVKIIGFAFGPDIQKRLMLACYHHCPTRVTVSAVEIEMQQIADEYRSAAVVA